VPKDEAIRYYRNKGDEYKLDLLQDLEDGQITFYTQGHFTDLCRGPHLPHTGYIKAVKLLSVAGAYWRGDENKPQLTRIYGITFPKQGMLEEYLEQLEEAKKRDHRKLGRELQLFAFSDKVGAGLPLWLPRGAIVRDQLEKFLKAEQRRRGYQAVYSPHIGKKDLYVTSGHYEKYGADSFQPIHTPDEKEEYLLKPMNCPHHCEIYNAMPRSYRDLPVRMAEFGTVYRYEQSGELNGLVRVRGFTQDDAHIFCTADQLKAEFKDVIDLTQTILHRLEFYDYTAQVSLRDPDKPEKYIGEKEVWDKSEAAIREAAQEMGLRFTEVPGEAAFYGPKLDFMVKDALKRSWQLGTIQVDYNLPQRFGLEYVASDNSRPRPVMIHRAPFGSMERFLGVLTEHCGGNFPVWLAPEQAIVLPISDVAEEYAHQVVQTLQNAEIRASIDQRNEKIGKKIRDAEVFKLPFMLIVGEKELAERTVSVRKHTKGDLGSMTIEQFVALIADEVNDHQNA
jgi:threonyl-tRNA synthetase